MVQLVADIPGWIWVAATVVILMLVVRAGKGAGSAKDPVRMYPAQLRHTGSLRANNQCEYSTPWLSRCTRTAQHADHFYPHSKGGATSMQNLVASCAPHNLSKSARIPTVWTRILVQQRRRKYFPASVDRTVGQWFR